MKKLKHLSFQETRCFNDEDIFSIADNLTELEYLDISYSCVSDEVLLVAVSKMKQLKCLDISCGRKITYGIVAALKELNNNLEVRH